MAFRIQNTTLGKIMEDEKTLCTKCGKVDCECTRATTNLDPNPDPDEFPPEDRPGSRIYRKSE